MKHKKEKEPKKLEYFEVPWGKEGTLKIMARSEGEAKKIALNLAEIIAGNTIRGGKAGEGGKSQG